MLSKLDTHEEYVKNLCDRLEELQGKTSLTAAEQKEEEEIIRKLNATIPDLNMYLDEQGRVISATTDNWRAYIDAQMEETKLEAVKERLLEIEKQKIDLEEELMEMNDNISEDLRERINLERERAELQQKYNESENELTARELERLQELWDMGVMLSENERKKRDALDETEAALNALNETEAHYRDRLEESTAATEQAAEATGEYAAANAEAVESTTTLAGMLGELIEDYDKAKEKAVESLEGQREAFENMNEGASESVDQIKEHLEKQAEAMKQYAEDIAEAQAIMEVAPESEGLLTYYIEQGPEAAGELEALIEAFNEGGESLQTFAEACEAFNETETMIEGLADLNLAIETGTTEAIELALEAIQTNMPEMQASLLENWELQQQDAENNRTKMTETTTGTMTDMKQAVIDGTPALSQAMVDAQNKVHTDAQTALGWNGEHYTKWWDVGLKIDQSIATGITDNADLIAEAVSSAVDSAIAAIDFSGITAGINVALGGMYGG
jgi:myosin heavy subunit